MASGTAETWKVAEAGPTQFDVPVAMERVPIESMFQSLAEKARSEGMKCIETDKKGEIVSISFI